MKLLPNAEMKNKLIDARTLSLDCNFFDLTFEETLCFTEEYCQFVKKLFAVEFVLVTYVGGYTSRRPEEHIRNSLLEKKYTHFNFFGDAISGTVYNKSSFHKYDKELRYPSYPSSRPLLLCSADYMDYYNREIFPYVDDRDALKQQILHLFYAPVRPCMFPAIFHDVACVFYTNQMPNGLYYGALSIDIGLNCIKACLGHFTAQLIEFIKEETSRYSGICGRLGLRSNPFHTHENEYLNFFKPSKNPENRSNYICGLSWANFVSPVILQQYSISIANTSKLEIDYLNNGGLLLKSAKPLDSDVIADLTEIKSLLYNALLPGKSTFPLHALKSSRNWSPFCKPRSFWEAVPVFPDEVMVTDEGVIIQRHIRT